MDRREFVMRGMGAFAGLGVAGTIAACGGSDGPTDPGGNGGGGNGGGGGGGNTVEVRDPFFQPAELTIQAGESVTWTHEGNQFHTITPDDGNSAWESQDFPNGAADFTVTFNTPGTYPYHCVPHLSQGMTGTITVE